MNQSTETDPRVLLLAPGDNVAIARCDLEAGTALVVQGHPVTLRERVLTGHKFAFRAVAKDERIFKYSAPIGRALADIAPGEPMHLHNITSDYIPTYTLDEGHEFPGEVHP
ncbi:MAG: UxaA family hydrolase [Betaproteobacteria bacterium]